MTDRQALLSAAGKQRPYKAVNIKPPAMPGVGFAFWGTFRFAIGAKTNWGLAKKGKVICYDVGRVLAPAADGRSYCNRTACRQDAGVIGTHLRTSACLLR